MSITNQGTHENISWTLTDDGTLTISGDGDMPNWKFDFMHTATVNPWYRRGIENKIKKVIIEEGITSVGSGAFDRCISIDEVILPNSVTKIGVGAFYECNHLKKINIQKVTRIGEDAFGYCRRIENLQLSENLITIGRAAFMASGLKNISIPNGVRKISDSTFLGCGDLEEINIPASVIMIEDRFDYCISLVSINVSPENKQLCSVDGVLFDKERKTLLIYPHNKSDEIYKIPDTVTKLDEDAFIGCMKLKELHIPKGVSNIDHIIDNPALELIEVSDENDYFTSVDGVVFSKNKTMLVNYPSNKQGAYSIPESVIKIRQGAFDCNYGLTSLYIPASVEEFDEPTECESLEEIIVSPNHKTLTSIDGVLFNKDRMVMIYYPENKPDKHYEIPQSVEIIWAKAMERIRNLETLFISDEVDFQTITNMFSLCPKLKHIEVSEGNEQFSSYDGVLFDKNGKTLLCYPADKEGEQYKINENVDRIVYFAFIGNRHLKTVDLSNVQYIDKAAFEDCDNIERFECNDHFSYENGTLWSREKEWVLWDKNYDTRQVWDVWIKTTENQTDLA